MWKKLFRLWNKLLKWNTIIKRICFLLLISSVVVLESQNFCKVCKAAKKYENDKLRIACEIGSGEDIRFKVLKRNLKILEKLTGIEFVDMADAEFGSSNEASVYYVEYAINEGVDGILLSPSSDQILPTVCRLCQDAGVYWGIYFRSIEDEEIREECESSPYYIGNICEDEENMGYNITKEAADMGYQKLGIISTVQWDTTGQRREQGIQKAMKEYPEIKILAEVRDVFSTEDVYKNTKSLLTAYPEIDCIFLVASKSGEAQQSIAKAIRDLGKNGEVGMAAIDFMRGFSELFDSECLESVIGLPQLTIDPYYLAIKMINTLKGYPIEEKCSTQTVPGIMVTSKKEARQLKKIVEDENLVFFSEEYIEKHLFKWNNPELDEQEFQKIINQNQRLKYSKSGN